MYSSPSLSPFVRFGKGKNKLCAEAKIYRVLEMSTFQGPLSRIESPLFAALATLFFGVLVQAGSRGCGPLHAQPQGGRWLGSNVPLQWDFARAFAEASEYLSRRSLPSCDASLQVR